MKVLHLVPRYWPAVGGAERYFQEISERLAEEGHEVTVYTADALDPQYLWSRQGRRIEEAESWQKGVRIRRFPLRHLSTSDRAFRGVRRLMTWIGRLPASIALPPLEALSRLTPYLPDLWQALSREEESYDLIHAASLPYDSLLGAALTFSRKEGVPLLVTPFTHWGEGVGEHYLLPHQIECLRQAESVLVQTCLEEEELVRRGVPRGKMFRVGVGISPAELAGGSGEAFCRRHGIEGRIIFSIGVMAYNKGTHHLLEASRLLWEKGQRFTLILAGAPTQAFFRFFKGQPEEVRRRCLLLGPISDAEKKDLLAAGDLLALPSRTDSFGMVFLEAWLYGKPVIGARAGGIPEVLSHERDGILVDFGDVPGLARAIERLLTDGELAARLGSAGREKVLREHTWDLVYKRIRVLYKAHEREGVEAHG